MTLSDFSIRRPVFAWMLICALIIFGTISATRLGVSQLPDVTHPVLTIQINWPGAAPELLETEIVDKVEEAMISLQGIKNIESTMRQGSAQVKLEFAFERNIDAALQETNARLRSVELPADVEPPVILKQNNDDNPILWLAVTTTRPYPELVKYIDLHLRDKFQIVPGVGDIILGGWANRSLRVWVDNDKLAKYDLTILDVRQALAREHQETTGGYLEGAQRELNVRTMGEGLTPEEVADIRITQRGGRQIYDPAIRIRDVARVEDGTDDIRRIARTNQVLNIGIGVRKQRGYNEVEVGRAVKKLCEELNKTLPPDIRIRVNYDATRFTEDAVKETQFTLVVSAIVTGIVCWAFLGSLRSTFNVLISIPTSVLGTFIMMHFMGFTLNFFTLLGLSLAIGIVVDDAIMVLENIVRHFHMGKTSEDAARDGAREITFAAVAATVSIMTIFLPVLFLKGTVGLMLFQFGMTISTAVALSLLEAITLTPMRCAQFMTAKEDESRFAQWVNRLFEKFARFYGRALAVCLRHRWKVIGVSAACFAASLFTLKFLRYELTPSQDAGILIMRFQTPVGSSLKFTSERQSEVERFLASQPWVSHYLVNAGGFFGGEINTGIGFVSLVPKSKRKIGHLEAMEIMRAEFKKIKDLKVVVIDPTQGSFSTRRGTSIELSVQGPDYAVLKEKTDEIVKKMEETGLMIDIDTDFRQGAPELQIIPDRQKAAASNVSMQVIAATVNAAMGGVRAGKFTSGERRYDMRLRLEPNQWSKVEDVSRLRVRTGYGETIPITDVAQTQIKPTLLTVTRQNRQRAITIYANVAPKVSQAKAVSEALDIGERVLPSGYRMVLTGSSQTAKESFQNLKEMLILGLIVSYMVLGVQFNSFVHPFTVLTALPFTLIGAALALLVTQQSFNLYSGIGLILLMGIVKKNSILLVEFFNKQRYERGKELTEAILSGGPIRLRPIMMTSTATAAAAVPAALGFGPGAEVRIPLAVVVIGGVIVSTFFTLLVVPCVYSLLSGVERRR
jgi:HAE1 family hydrophobic/amphiphilic exporter-1